LDKHCPLQTRRKIAPTRQVNRWLSDRAIEAKRARQRLERRWKCKGNNNTYVAYRRACRVANKELIKARNEFYSNYIAEAARDPRRRWSAIRDILHVTDTKTYQSPEESQKLCNTFLAFLMTKSIRPKKPLEFGCQLTILNRYSTTRLSQVCHWTICRHPPRTRSGDSSARCPVSRHLLTVYLPPSSRPVPTSLHP